MNALCSELILAILNQSCLKDAKGLLRCVCREWRDLIQTTTTHPRVGVMSVSLIKWARDNGLLWDSTIYYNAARGGHLKVLEWVYANGCVFPEYSWRLTIDAARSGSFKVFMWVQKRGGVCHVDACAAAAEGGCVEILEWLYVTKGHPIKLSVLNEAALHGHMNVLSWATIRCQCVRNSYTCMRAAQGGHLEILKWLQTHKFPWDESTCTMAARGGHLNILQWARANGCPWDTKTCAQAAGKGRFELLQWASAHGCPWDEETCASAAEGGHLKLLRWVRAHGCPWDSRTCTYAAIQGHFKIFHWARTNGCPWKNERILLYAIRHNNMDMFEWARSNGCPWHVEVIEEAIKHDRWDVLKMGWLKYGEHWHIHHIRLAVRYNRVMILDRILNNNRGWLDKIGKYAIEFRRWEILELVSKYRGCLNGSVCVEAAKRNDIMLLQWVRKLEFPWHASVCYWAVHYKNVKMFVWARAHGCPCDSALLQNNHLCLSRHPF